MSPEQAMGEREITPKADIYALGCVLYEMLTGEPPFTGPTAQAIIARVMTEVPRSLTLQRHTVPPHVEAAVVTALEKLPADRFASAAQFAEALAGHGPAIPARAATVATAVASPAGARWQRRFQVAAAVAVAALAFATWGWVRAGRAAHAGATWRYISLGDSVALSTTIPALALSPDGSTLAFREIVSGGRLWIKRKGDLNASPIPGTERASFPVFSPDGDWIAFVADGHVKKMRSTGGAIITVADSAASGNGFGGAAWLDDGTLLYVSTTLNGLLRVSAAGGPSTIAMRDSVLGGLGVGVPTPLPGARGVLFVACSSGCVTSELHVLDLRTGSQRLLLGDVAQGWYLPSGQLLYVRRDGVALVAPFDLGRLEVSGPAVPVLEGVLIPVGSAQLAWSPSGSLIYMHGTGGFAENTMVRVGRNGVAAPIDTSWAGSFNAFALSPDGRRLAVGLGASTGALNVWIKQLDKGPLTRLTFGGQDRRPVWSPDGHLVAFVRDTAGTSIVVARPADGSGPDRRLSRLDRQIQEVAWSRDGRWLVVRTDNSTTGAGDIVGVRTSGDSTPVPLVFSPFTELHPAPSPDGRWLAYTSNESGTNEVYVRPFPNTGDGRWQVSNGGGIEPRWSSNGRELFYLSGAGRLVAAQVAAGPSFAVTELRQLFDASGFTVDPFHQTYDVTPDGRFFIFAAPRQSGAAARAPQIVQVDDWFADVRARLRQ
jgi:serine/threonine-protein kinase